MDASSTEDYGAGCTSSQTEGVSAGQRYQSVDSRAEWRSGEQLENGTPSTSPSYWDIDDDDDCGPRPSELYGTHTWKIENYSQINKRELRSDEFEIGGYKWYILVYPQGCDVCNHLSLFLCVANHDKLLPGWSHFAQFTISVENRDPKHSKFSDTLHRFWKKEHDWGWKKFMELTKVEDGFVNDETLIINAQVQVIREKAHRPFRCLDCKYRRELMRVYLSNVEQICRRFFEDRRNKLIKLIDDQVRWSSFCSFWLGIDQNSRRRISRDKLDTILRVVVKHFFVEKEVTSTLVMDSLYSGLKFLECQSKNKKKTLMLEMEESAVPMVQVDKDMFVLADDVISLLERVAAEALPAMSLPPKDDKITQNRTKEGNSADDIKDSVGDERRLTELGRRTIEIFVLAHIFSRIEVAYQEAVALKRQEELIREEEAAGQAEHELKAKRSAAEKDKRTKKKQSKQKRNNRKNKEKQRDLKSDSIFIDKKQEEKSLTEITSTELSLNPKKILNERIDKREDASDLSHNGDDAAEPLYPDLEDRDRSPRNWDIDESEIHPFTEAGASEMSNSRPEKTNIGLDDSSSTCSTDSVPPVLSNGSNKGNSVIIKNIQTSPNRAKNYGSKHLQSHVSVASHSGEIIESSPSTCHELDGDDTSQKRLIQRHEGHLVEKQEPTAIILQKTSKAQNDAEKLSSDIRPLESSSASPEPVRKTQSVPQQPKQPVQNNTIAATSITSSITLPAPLKEPKRSSVPSAKSPLSSSSRSEAQKLYSAPAAKNITAQPAAPYSRPFSAPLMPAAPRSTIPLISTAQATPHLSRSASATTRSNMDASLSAPSYVPQSYRNAIIGKTTMGGNPVEFTHSSSTPPSQSSASSSQSIFSTSSALFPPPSASRKERFSGSRSVLSFGSVKPEASHTHPQSIAATNTELRNSNHLSEPVSATSLHQSHVGVVDEFPHLDIINELLDEEQSTSNPHYYPPLHHRRHSFNGRYSFSSDSASIDLSLLSHNPGRFDQTEQYYDIGFSSIHGGSSDRALERFQDGHFDLSTAYGLIQSQWPYNPADLSVINLGGTDGSGGGGGGMYSYHNISDYANTGRGLNRYGLYRP